MEIFLSFIFDVLVGRHAGLKQYAAAIGFIGLTFLAFATFFGYGASPHPDNFYLALTIVSAIAAIALFVQLIIWRVGERSSRSQSQNAYATIKALRASGKLTQDSSPLIMADWAGVKLKNADLHDANFNKTGLEGADLSHANLCGANLRSARLNGANLREADLATANLAYARLQNADLRNAQLAHADLTAANLSGAQLKGAHLEGARCDQHTTLPDGTKWTRKTDWKQFEA